MEKAYETYMDSGVEWIGEIPESWFTGKVGFFSDVYRGSGYQLLNEVNEDFSERKEKVLRIGDFNSYNPIWCEYKDQFENYRINENDLLIGGTGHYFGKSLIVTKEMVGLIHSYNIIRLVIKNINSNFVSYWMSSSLIREQMDLSVLGSGQPFIDIQGLKDLKIVIPPKQEQTQIAAYLDYHTQLIDTLISKKETLLQKLQEQRQAIINEAVTKGLNKNVALRDSGIEWLGEIPEHWEVTSIKNILAIPITDGPHTTPKLYDEGIPFISAESIRNNEIDFNRKRGYISEEDYELFSKKYLPKINDIYMVKSGATTGNIGIVKTEEKFTIWSPLAVFRAKSEKVFYEYLFYYLQSSLFKYQVELNWSYGTQQNIGMGVLSNLKISYPSVVEQQNIVSFIKNSALKIVTNIEKIQTSIQKLKEYRQSLISEAVTGKIDVRDWQQPIN